jgi:hypothetical protein
MPYVFPGPTARTGGPPAALSITVLESELLPSVAVTTADCPEATVLAVAVNPAEVAPAGTVSDAGTGSAKLFELSATEAPPEGAGPLRMTVQVVEPAGARLDGLHATEFGLTGGVAGAGGASVTTALCELPFKVAVTVALWLVLTLAAFAVKVADVNPAATVIDDGTGSAASLLLKVTAVPPLGAAPLSVTEHVEVDGVTSEEGLHESRLTVTGAKTEMAPPAPVEAMASPPELEATVLLNPRASVPVVADTVALMVASTPSEIAVWFSPEAIQI